MAMSSNASGSSPTTTSNPVAIIPTNPMTTRPSAVTTSSPARPVANIPQVQSQSQPRPLQFLQHQRQLHPLHLHPHTTNQQQLAAQTQIQTHNHAQTQTQTQTQTYQRQQLGKAAESILYPLASSGRGLLPTPRGVRPRLPDETIRMGSSSVHPSIAAPARRSTIAAFPHPPLSQTQHQHAQFFTSESTQPQQSSYMIRPPYLHPSHCQLPSVSVSAIAASGGVGGVSLNPQAQAKPKAASVPRVGPESNGQKNLRDDTCVTVRDRKVRISDEESIYGLCRSWLRNGYPGESKPQYGDFMRSLPKPSPMPTSESLSPKRKESNDETEAEEDEKSVEDVSPKGLLQRHIKKAKRVRARLREERLVRIERYKNRLTLLLPPVLDQCRNDSTTGA